MSAPDWEHAIDSQGHWLVFWTIVVAAGLVVEYAKAWVNAGRVP
jgi:hypothetical protein